MACKLREISTSIKDNDVDLLFVIEIRLSSQGPTLHLPASCCRDVWRHGEIDDPVF